MAFYEVGVDHQRDRSVGFEYNKLSDPRRSLPVLPRFLYGDISEKLLAFYFSQHEIWGTGLWQVRDITVFGPGLLARGSQPFGIKETNTFQAAYEGHAKLHNVAPQFGEHETSSLVDPVLLINPGYPVYGHWLVDFLPKLYVLMRNGLNFRSVKYILPKDCPKFGIEWLRLLGVPHENIVFYDGRIGCRYTRILVPTLLRTNSRASELFQSAIAFICDHLGSKLDHSRVVQCERIFVSRGQWSAQGRQLINRGDVETIARDAGYTIYLPEKHSLLDQISAFNNAAACAGEYGSAMHNSIFCKQGTPICLLRSSQTDPGFLQSGIGAALGHPTGYVIGKAEANTPRFSVNTDSVRHALNMITKPGLLA